MAIQGEGIVLVGCVCLCLCTTDLCCPSFPTKKHSARTVGTPSLSVPLCSPLPGCRTRGSECSSPLPRCCAERHDSQGCTSGGTGAGNQSCAQEIDCAEVNVEALASPHTRGPFTFDILSGTRFIVHWRFIALYARQCNIFRSSRFCIF